MIQALHLFWKTVRPNFEIILQWSPNLAEESTTKLSASGMTQRMGPTSGGLNPLAAEFVPCFRSQSQRYTGWGRDGCSKRNMPTDTPHLLPGGGTSCNILDAPDEVLNKSNERPFLQLMTDISGYSEALW